MILGLGLGPPPVAPWAHKSFTHNMLRCLLYFREGLCCTTIALDMQLFHSPSLPFAPSNHSPPPFSFLVMQPPCDGRFFL